MRTVLITNCYNLKRFRYKESNYQNNKIHCRYLTFTATAKIALVRDN